MQWPQSVDPTRLPDFEMKARQFRYRLIAEAAISRKIRHLFLGHHQDDQVETILMRLVRNSNTSFLGLQGMPEHSTIPCCEDIKGALDSQHTKPFTQWVQHPSPTPYDDTRTVADINKGKAITPLQPNGLQLHRPLLQYPKIELVNFCQKNNVPYVTDKTNYDPTLTLRNAVRHLRSHYALPKALQAGSILQLRSWANQATISLMDRGIDALRDIKVHAFDLRSGLMTISLSQQFIAVCESDPEAGANALARLTSVVSPQSKDDEPTVVPRRNLEEFLQKIKSLHPQRMTIQQVLIDKRSSKSQEDNEQTILSLTRPPMRTAEAALSEMSFLAKRSAENTNEYQTTSPNQAAENIFQEPGIWSEWILWDHRYWIRLRSRNNQWLSRCHIRNYRDSDDITVEQTLKKTRHNLHDVLREAAPGKLRYTIPVLTVDGKVAIFPTLNYVVQKEVLRDALLEWDVCYKVIDQPFINNHRSDIEWRNADMAR